MTDRDVLERASEALRNAGEPSPEELARLRGRVLNSNVKPLGSRRVPRSVRWLLPLAAAFMAASALAATPGAWHGMLEAAERFLHIELLAKEQASAKKPRVKTATQNAMPTTREAAPANAAPGPAPEPAPARAAEPRAADFALQTADTPVTSLKKRGPRAVERPEAAVPTTAAVAAKESAAPAGPSQDLLLYRRAHELHFRARSYAQALSAWDAYLQQLPTGTFAIEAKYNRALCLVRLGRYSEARTALAEFADGKPFGGYRQEEATRVIEALDKRR